MRISAFLENIGLHGGQNISLYSGRAQEETLEGRVTRDDLEQYSNY